MVAPPMPPKPLAYNALLTRREDFTPELTTFHIRFDESMPDGAPSFIPGQYVALGLNNDAKSELGSVRRSMSLASAPEQKGGYEFYIRYVKHPESENPLTHLLWKMALGDRIFMTKKPVGVFTIDHTAGTNDKRLCVFVAAGTGLAPFVSMVRSDVLRNPKVDLSRYVLLHGASYPNDICYREELEKYGRENGLHYFKTISRPKEAPGWAGDVGRVEDYFLPDRLAALEEKVGLKAGEMRPDRAAILICGLQGTIGETIIRMVPRGYVPDNRRIRNALEIPDERPSNIWWEQYDNTPVIDINDPDLVARFKQQLQTAWSA